MTASKVFRSILAMVLSASIAAVVGVWREPYDLNVINDFYNSASETAASILAGQLDAIDLSGIDMLWAVQPGDDYTNAGIAAMAHFLSDGKRITFMGEHGLFAPAENVRITAALGMTKQRNFSAGKKVGGFA